MTLSPAPRPILVRTSSARPCPFTVPVLSFPQNSDMNYSLRLGLFMLVAAAAPVCAEMDNLKVVTDASPDYSDMDSLIHSVTSRWDTPEEKLSAMFYWNHLARRQTNPMM